MTVAALAPAAPRPRLTILVAFAVLYVVWGSTFLGMRYAVRGGMTPFLGAAARTLGAGGLMLAWARARGHRPVPRRCWPDLALSGALMFVGGGALSMFAAQAVDSGLVALLSATAPLWLTLGAAHLPGGERPSPRGWAGIALGFAGLALVLAPGLRGGQTGAGLIAGAVSPVGWTAGALWARQRLGGLTPLAIASHQMLFAAGALLLVGVARGELGALHPTGSAWLALGYLMLFGNLLGFTAFVFLMAHAPAARVATYAYVNPLVALFLGWWIAGEPIGPRALAGAAVIVAGVALTNTARVRRNP
jgi:drug/metabolite transporter (DMT)-like permease